MTHPIREQESWEHPKRIQRRRTKDWRMPEGAIYVGRGTRWGNPFLVAKYGRNKSHGLYT